MFNNIKTQRKKKKRGHSQESNSDTTKMCRSPGGLARLPGLLQGLSKTFLYTFCNRVKTIVVTEIIRKK